MAKRGKKRARGHAESAVPKKETVTAAAAELGPPRPQRPQHRPVIPDLKALKAASTSTATSTALTIPAGKKFLTVTDGTVYQETLREHYKGFVLLPAAQISPASFHAHAATALERLRDAGYYQYDMVMAGGKNLSRTFVQRTLVGEPGITYKYLGLRLFAHAWSGPDSTDLMRAIYHMNQEMIRLTKEQLRQYTPQRTNQLGSCEYNLTLINYMEPSSEAALRDEEAYGMGKASVSWHADSSLQDYSSIGVYHTLPTQKASKWDWKIALRRNPDDHAKETDSSKTTRTAAATNNKTVLPVVVPTKSGDAYFLLHDFNHFYQHMVLAGSQARRISSTHRVAVVATDTYEYIRARCSTALVSLKAELRSAHDRPWEWNVQVILDGQAVLTEVELEWIAQYWVQGAQHDVQHVWWQAPMRALEQAWCALEKQSYKIYGKLLEAAAAVSNDEQNRNTKLSALLSGLLEAFRARQELRTKWDDRRADKIYKRRISRPYQPVERPVFEDSADPAATKRLSKDLTEAIDKLTHALSRFESHSTIKSTTPRPNKRPKQRGQA
jgi:mRNA N6-methyladenine demethylase